MAYFPDMIHDPIAEAVRRYMHRHRLEVADVANRAKIHRSTLSHWLNGSRSLSLPSLIRVLRVLGMLDCIVRKIEEA